MKIKLIFCYFNARKQSDNFDIWHGDWLDIDCFEDLYLNIWNYSNANLKSNTIKSLYQARRIIYVVVQR